MDGDSGWGKRIVWAVGTVGLDPLCLVLVGFADAVASGALGMGRVHVHVRVHGLLQGRKGCVEHLEREEVTWLGGIEDGFHFGLVNLRSL